MITNARAAKLISDSMLGICSQIEQSLDDLKEISSPEDFARYHKAIGKVVAPIMFEVLEPLYEEHPDLKPPGWD
jgi:hypothetical protein